MRLLKLYELFVCVQCPLHAGIKLSRVDCPRAVYRVCSIYPCTGYRVCSVYNRLYRVCGEAAAGWSGRGTPLEVGASSPLPRLSDTPPPGQATSQLAFVVSSNPSKHLAFCWLDNNVLQTFNLKVLTFFLWINHWMNVKKQKNMTKY